MHTVKVLGNYINGKFVRSKKPDDKIISVDPGDSGYRVGSFPVYNDHIDDALDAAQKAFPDWSSASQLGRADTLRKFAAEVVNNRKELIELIASETGKPLWEAELEVKEVESRVEMEIREGVRPVSPFRVGEIRFGVEGSCYYHPLGVVVVLGPAISPVRLATGLIIPALLSGNTVVFKPSKLVPACGQFVAKMFDEMDLPKGVFNLVQGDGAVGLSLATHPVSDVILFSGSYPSGRRILQAVFEQPNKLVALQNGGMSVSIVLDDADMDRAVYENICASFLTTGQRYSSAGVVMVQKTVFERFSKEFVDVASAMKVDYAFEKDVFMGPVLSEQAIERFLDLQQRLGRAGTKTLLKATKLQKKRPGFYLSPGIHLAESIEDLDMFRPDGLSFGPDVVLVPVENEKKAVELANSTDFAFAASVFSKDEERLQECSRSLRYGIVNHNLATTEFSMRLPLGPVGKCGNFRPAGLFAQRNCTFPVASVRATTRFDADRIIKAYPKK